MGGYSDWFILPRKDFDVVSRKLGVTSAMGLFVEIAIPTVMSLYCEELKTLRDTKYTGGAMWTQGEIDQLANAHELSLQHLLENFPQDKLFLHPVKLSKWKTESFMEDEGHGIL